MKQINSIPKGYKVSSLGIIPEGWDVKKLGDLIELSSGKTKPKDTSNMPFDNCIYPVFGGNGILGYSKEFSHILPQIIIGRVGEYCGNILLVNEKCWVTDNALYTKIISDSCNISYLTYKLQFEDLSKLRSKGGQPLISQQPIYLYKIVLPPIPEQQKIAEILSVWDNAIDLQTRLITSMQTRKQGLMQQLLTGKKRLKGFDGEWKIVRLGEIIYLQGGYAFKSESFSNEGTPVIRISDIYNNKVDINKSVCVEKIEIAENFVIKKNDILIAMSGATTGKIGIYKKTNIAYLNQRVGKFIITNPNETSQRFISHIVRSDMFTNHLSNLLEQGAQPNISGKQIESIRVKIPINRNEQTAIASILSFADNEISLAQKKLVKMKAQKKGLMQQLLTGKRRVKV